MSTAHTILLRARPIAVLAAVLIAFFLGASTLQAQALHEAVPEDVGLSSERLERLSETFQAYVDDGRLAGAVALVARHGEVAYFQAFGDRDREAGAPMTEDALFRIASQTKALISVGVMILQEEGRLLISDPVADYLPEFGETTVAVPVEGGGYAIEPVERPITIRHLLTHTAGIGYGGGPARDRWEAAGITGWYFADRDEPIRATVARMPALPFDAQPGQRWVYGYATDILGALIEEASGEALDDFLQSRILDPLGMTDTHFYVPREKADRLAVVYAADDEGGIVRAPELGGMAGQGQYVDGPRTSFSGGAGLVSSAMDYARFLQMLLNGGELDGARVLSPTTVDLMTVDHLGDVSFSPGEGFGLGFYVVEDLGARGEPGSVGEFGWGGAYHSTYWVDPQEQLVVVYFTQLRPTGGLDDHGKLRALVYQAIVE